MSTVVCVPRSRFVRGGGAFALIALIAGCRAAPAPSPALHAVSIRGMQFDPAVVRVAVGDTVRWTNRDLVPHTVTAADGAFDSGSVAPDSSWSLVVRAAGAAEYACRFHPTMKGTVVAGR